MIIVPVALGVFLFLSGVNGVFAALAAFSVFVLLGHASTSNSPLTTDPVKVPYYPEDVFYKDEEDEKI